MRDQEDQMDLGSAGALRGQSHVRIPQRRINRSLRTGVSPSMAQMQNGQGHFQANPIISNRVQPLRQMPRFNRGNMFNQFMNRATGGPFANKLRGKMDLPGHGQGADHHQNYGPGMHGQMSWRQAQQNQAASHNPLMQHLLQNANGFGGHGGGGRFGPLPHPIGGQPPIAPGVGQGGHGPMLGNGQSIHGLIQALMGDVGQGFNADQFANMQHGNLPGGEQGDFLRALGGGDGNDNVLQSLIQHLIANPATNSLGQPETAGYHVDPNGGLQAIQQLLRGAVRNRFAPPAPKPPRNPLSLLGKGGEFRHRFPGQFQQYPLMPGGGGGPIMPAGLPR